MADPLTPALRRRLVKLLGMLGSDQSGEVANAGRLANQLVHEAGLTWAEIMGVQPAREKRRSPQQAVHDLLDDFEFADICYRILDELPDLTGWEEKFVRSIMVYAFSPDDLSPRQGEIFMKLVWRLVVYMRESAG